MIRALVIAAVVILIFVVTAQVVPVALDPYLLPLLMLFTLVVTVSVVRLQRRELIALEKRDKLREQMAASRSVWKIQTAFSGSRDRRD